MKKYVCSVCGYIHNGEEPPEKCPECGAGADKFSEKVEGEGGWADEHKIGVAKGVDAEVVEMLQANFKGECTEVGMYLAMSRQADREGFPEVAEAYKRIAFEEAEHAAKFAELLGEVVHANTKVNLKLRADAERGACAGKKRLATRAKELNYDAIHDTVHEMCKDEARHGSAFTGLLNRYFPSAKGPIPVDVKAGERKSFCTCGYSMTMPFCDNAHRVVGGKSKAHKFEKDETIKACACGKSGNLPFCDGTHKKS